MSTPYKVKAIQSLIDDFNNVSAEIEEMCNTYNIDLDDVKSINVVGVGTSFLISIVYQGIEKLTQLRIFSGILNFVSSGIETLKTLVRSKSTKIGLLSSISFLSKLSHTYSTSIELILKLIKFTCKSFETIIYFIESFNRIIELSKKQKDILIGIKVKQFEAIWNEVPIEE